MSDEESHEHGNPLVVIGDKIQPKPHLIALLQQLRTENNLLSEENSIKYAVCSDSTDVALALRKYLNSVKMILIGPGLGGNISEHLWELIDFKTFFKLCYITSPKIKSASIAFLQQTA